MKKMKKAKGHYGPLLQRKLAGKRRHRLCLLSKKNENKKPQAIMDRCFSENSLESDAIACVAKYQGTPADMEPYRCVPYVYLMCSLCVPYKYQGTPADMEPYRCVPYVFLMCSLCVPYVLRYIQSFPLLCVPI